LQTAIVVTEKELSLIIIIPTPVMDSNNMISQSKDGVKSKVAIPLVPATVTIALLLLGLSFISSFQPTIAQQQDTTTGGEGGGGTTTGSGAEGGNTSAATSQNGNTTAGGRAVEGGNDSLSQIRMHIEAVRTALQNNDIQGAMLHLELLDNALGGAGVLQVSNMTDIDTTAAGNATNMTTAAGNATNMTTAAGGGGGAGNATTGDTEGGEVITGIF
jgi:hypothetical protein